MVFGECIYSDGVSYIGHLRNWKKHGQGTLLWPDRVIFKGEFKDNRRSSGEMLYPDKTTVALDFQNGQTDGYKEHSWIF